MCEARWAVIENTMFVSFDSKLIRRDQKQRRNGEACRASPSYFWSSLVYLISKDTYVVFFLSCIICRFNIERQRNKWKADTVLFELAASRMRYGVNPWRHLPIETLLSWSMSALAYPLQRSLLKASPDNIRASASAVLQWPDITQCYHTPSCYQVNFGGDIW